MVDFDARAKEFWQDMEGLKDLLNSANPNFTIASHKDETILHYLLWRLLAEIKELGLSNEELKKVIKDANRGIWHRKLRK